MLQIYNTLSRPKEPFKPTQAGQVRMYRVADSGHYIHVDQPKMVARAVLQQIHFVRTTDASRCRQPAEG